MSDEERETENGEVTNTTPESETDMPEVADDKGEETTFRATNSDPIFGLVLAGAISIGLSPIIDTDADMRYSIVWGMLALFGVLAWLFGTAPRIEEEDPINLAWGVVFGLVLSIPVLAFVGGTLTDISEALFPDLRTGTVLAYLIFVMPLAETLFFRALIQQNYAFWLTALMCSVWQTVLFFPLLNQGPLPLITGIILLMANLLFGYVRNRNGLAAAWVCQITVNIMLLFMPFAGL